MKKVYIVDSSLQYERMFVHQGYEVVSNPELADLLCFTGGEDVHPSLYGEKLHKTTCSNLRRDMGEREYFLNHAGRVPLVGICRGGQFLNVMCGGKLWQDVDNHARYGNHKLVDEDTREVYMVTSTHHQMMRPGGGAVVVATADESTYYENDVQRVDATELDDVEVLLYPKLYDKPALCFQPHPEFISAADTTKYFFKLIDKHLFGGE